MTIIQQHELSIEERANLLYDQSKQLPCWNKCNKNSLMHIDVLNLIKKIFKPLNLYINDTIISLSRIHNLII